MTSRYIAAISIVVIGLIATDSASSEAKKNDHGRYGMVICDDVGSPAHAIGVGLELRVKLDLLPPIGLDLALIASSGDENCLQKMAEEAPTFAIVNSTIAETFLVGSQSPDGGHRIRPLLISALWEELAHFVIAKDNFQGGTLGDFTSLQTEQLAIDPALSKAAVLLLAKAGISIKDRGDLRLPMPRDLLDAMGRGSMIGLAVLEPVPSSIVMKLLQQFGGKFTLLELSQRHVGTDGKGWHVRQIPPGTYPDIDRPIETIGHTVMMVADAEVPNEAVYQLTKIMFETLPNLAQVHEVAAQITIDRAIKDVDLPLHPGAARYYREIGVLPYEAGALKISQPN